MEVRITFRSEVVIKGRNMEEIRDKWEEMPLFTDEAEKEHSAEFIEIVSVEDNHTDDDIMEQWNKETYR